MERHKLSSKWKSRLNIGWIEAVFPLNYYVNSVIRPIAEVLRRDGAMLLGCRNQNLIRIFVTTIDGELEITNFEFAGC